MKLFSKIIILLFLLLGNVTFAQQVLVLPVDMFSDNYYSFPEFSQIIADDVIENFNNSNGKMSALTMYDVNKKISTNSTLKASVSYVLSRYKNDNYVDFANLKKISQSFNVKYVMLISAVITQNNLKRNIWEVLEISSAFEAINNYPMEINVVLTDNDNDIVFWSGKYKKQLGDSVARFWAKSSAQAASQLEKLKDYSKNIVAKTISQNVMLRFYPKTIKAVEPVKVETTIPEETSEYKTNPFEFKPSPLGDNYNRYKQIDNDIELDEDPTFAF